MGSKKLLITGAAIAVVAAAAILVPSIAAGVPFAGFVPVSSVVAPDDGPGNNGRGNAFGHDKDSPGFPGNNANRGRGNDDRERAPGAEKHEDGPGNNGRGNAFGHDKDSPDFPGSNGDEQDDADE